MVRWPVQASESSSVKGGLPRPSTVMKLGWEDGAERRACRAISNRLTKKLDHLVTEGVDFETLRHTAVYTLDGDRGNTHTVTSDDDQPSNPSSGLPENVIVVLLDSMNRHDLGCYGGTDFETPNLDRFATGAVRFERHVTGSLPCMPARHDILCGNLDFLWRPWGSIELWEKPITEQLRHDGVVTMLMTDHPHLFETGGENYHTDFTGWEYLRGHEGDLWKTHIDPTWIGSPALPARDGRSWWRERFGMELAGRHSQRGSDRSRTFFKTEADFPGPKVMAGSAEWLRNAAPQHRAAGERWMLFIDEFDPHEPFDTPEPWATKYDDWVPEDGERLIWPPYAVGAIADGHLTEQQGRHIRANYGAKLSMIDHWFGLLLDELDRPLEDGSSWWDSTAVVVCTDHGHYLGDVRDGQDIWGKPSVPQFEPLGHTPLLIRWPGVAASTSDALTTNVDLHATLADVFGTTTPYRTHGTSLVPLLTGEQHEVREWAIGGVFGNWVQITDGRHKYARGPVGDQFPLSMWSNRWSTMPVHMAGVVELPLPDQRATLATMPGTDVPVIRQPFAAGDHLPLWVGKAAIDNDYLFDLSVDPDETENRVGESIEADMQELLRTALVQLDAPDDQFTRLLL